jgi:hypothetical protein
LKNISKILPKIETINSVKNTIEIIDKSIKDDPAVTITEGNIIRFG